MLIKKGQLAFEINHKAITQFEDEFNSRMSNPNWVSAWVRDAQGNPQWWFWVDGWNTTEQNMVIEIMIREAGYSKVEFENVEDRTRNTLIKVFS